MHNYKSKNQKKQIPSLGKTVEGIDSNIGPIGYTESQNVDVNTVFELPETLRNERDLTPKDWCHCAAESDWCDEDCHQPHNNPALKKGGCDGK